VTSRRLVPEARQRSSSSTSALKPAVARKATSERSTSRVSGARGSDAPPPTLAGWLRPRPRTPRRRVAAPSRWFPGRAEHAQSGSDEATTHSRWAPSAWRWGQRRGRTEKPMVGFTNGTSPRTCGCWLNRCPNGAPCRPQQRGERHRDPYPTHQGRSGAAGKGEKGLRDLAWMRRRHRRASFIATNLG
jgi:hypothetical protein